MAAAASRRAKRARTIEDLLSKCAPGARARGRSWARAVQIPYQRAPSAKARRSRGPKPPGVDAVTVGDGATSIRRQADGGCGGAEPGQNADRVAATFYILPAGPRCGPAPIPARRPIVHQLRGRGPMRIHTSLLVPMLVVAAAGAEARTVVVHQGQSIQDAIDRVSPPATIVIEPGIYHESSATRALTITKSGIRLIGKPRPGNAVVLEQIGTQTQGIWISPADTLDPADVEQPPCGINQTSLDKIMVRGLTVQGFAGFGVYLACVDRFEVRSVTARDNHTYAIFPVRSSHGRMTRNTVSGTLSDACLYVGQDDHILVDHNQATDCLIGLQIENSTNTRFTHNDSHGNTAGMIVDILNGRQVKEVSDNLVADNMLADNNRPNTAPPEEDTSMIQPGIGLIVDGAHTTRVIDNTIGGNTLAGVTLVNFCFMRDAVCAVPLDVDPNPIDNRFLRNTFTGNTIDVIYAPDQGAFHGSGNCFTRNKPSTLNAVGGPLPACH
jgi:parallel beta-helix repeat protein